MMFKKTFFFLILNFTFVVLFAQEEETIVQDSIKIKPVNGTVIKTSEYPSAKIISETPTVNKYSVTTKPETTINVITNSSGNITETLPVIATSENTFHDLSQAQELDTQWLTALYNSPLNDFYIDEKEIGNYDIPELSTNLLKERLAHLNSTTPFNIEYNASLESVIKTYLKRRKKGYAGLLEKAKYYFPMFEEQLDKYNIPLEMKYLAIVESALKPKATSRVGAKGLWQFMYQTGKQFGLNISSYVDERQDPYRATEAACKYLSSLYTMFNDWDLALAAYNSGPGNVNKAIRRSGGSKNYWNIRHHLPRETAGYVPAFYATMYLFEYAEEHHLKPLKKSIRYFETDSIQLKRQLTFSQITKVTKINLELLQFLNPQYKLDIIPFVKDKNYKLVLPIKEMGVFLTNEQQIYAFAVQDDAKREKPLPKYIEQNTRIRYRVKNGDFLGKIASKYGVSVSKLKRWNNLKSNKLRIGQRLSIYPNKPVSSSTHNFKTQKKRPKKPLPKAPHEIYVVKEGDSLWGISKQYKNVTVQNIKDWNDIWSVKNLKLGMKLKIFKI